MTEALHRGSVLPVCISSACNWRCYKAAFSEVMSWPLRLSVWFALAAPVLAASGPLYIDSVVDDRHIVVVTREGEALLLERRTDDAVPSLPVAGRHVFASERETGTLLLDAGKEQTAWAVVRSFGWNPRKTIRYWLLVVVAALVLSPLVVWAWRQFAAATESASVSYSHGPPPELWPGEHEALALPSGWRQWASGVSAAALALLGVTAVSLMGLVLLVAPGNVDAIRRPTIGVVATDVVATSVGVVVVLWLLVGYTAGIRQLWWSVSRRLSFAIRHRTRTTATLRHAGTITTESGSDATIDEVHVLVYAFTARLHGRMQTFVVREAVSNAQELAVGRSLEIEFVTGQPSVIRRL